MQSPVSSLGCGPAVAASCPAASTRQIVPLEGEGGDNKKGKKGKEYLSHHPELQEEVKALLPEVVCTTRGWSQAPTLGCVEDPARRRG